MKTKTFKLRDVVFPRWFIPGSPEIKALPMPKQTKSGSWEGLYGLYETKDGKRYLDGACGMESMLRILRALGYEVRCYSTSKLSDLIVAVRL